jgi:hypothetical protein
MSLARVAATSTLSIEANAHTVSPEETECRLRAHSPRMGAAEVLVSVDSSPQPYYRLERQAVEDTQVFTAHRLTPAPEEVKGIGEDAYWFPALNSLLSTDGTRLFTVKVNWPGRSAHGRRALAIAIAHAYL